MVVRRTQEERRAETRAAVLASATRLFGRKGYADTSLDEIASDAGVTTRPIYHYFGSKLELFEAVNAGMEERIVASLQESEGDDLEAWQRYLTICEDPEFRQIVMLDAPKVLGRERWATSRVTRTVAARLGSPGPGIEPLPELGVRMLIAALAEAALGIAEADDPTRASREAGRLVSALVSALSLSQRPERPSPPKEDPS